MCIILNGKLKSQFTRKIGRAPRLSYRNVPSHSGGTEVVGGFTSDTDGHNYLLISNLVTLESVLHHKGSLKKMQAEKEIQKYKKINYACTSAYHIVK